MKATNRQILMLAAIAAAGVAPAIEPPVDSQPVPPQAPAREIPAARAVPVVPVEQGIPPKAEPVPMPEVAAARPFLGVILDPVPEILSRHLQLGAGEGLVIGDLVPGGPAELAGLAADDLLTRVGGEIVGTPDDVRAQVEKHGVGDTVQVEVIQKGERRNVDVVLGAAPPPGQPGLAMGDRMDLEQWLEQLPEKHAGRLRELMEQNLQQPMMGLDDQFPGLPDGLIDRIRDQVGKKGGFDFGDLAAESTIRLMDEQGSIEMKNRDGRKQAKVYDKDGSLRWEGPYDTEQDKAAVPDEIRQRIDKLNLDFDIDGNGMRLHLGPERFRPLEQIEPAEPEPAPEPNE